MFGDRTYWNLNDESEGVKTPRKTNVFVILESNLCVGKWQFLKSGVYGSFIKSTC